MDRSQPSSLLSQTSSLVIGYVCFPPPSLSYPLTPSPSPTCSPYFLISRISSSPPDLSLLGDSVFWATRSFSLVLNYSFFLLVCGYPFPLSSCTYIHNYASRRWKFIKGWRAERNFKISIYTRGQGIHSLDALGCRHPYFGNPSLCVRI